MINIEELEEEARVEKRVKEKLKKHFNFEIPDYIINDIAIEEDYHHFCLMVNVAVLNNRLSKEDGNALKEKTKSLFNINSSYEKLRVECLC